MELQPHQEKELDCLEQALFTAAYVALHGKLTSGIISGLESARKNKKRLLTETAIEIIQEARNEIHK